MATNPRAKELAHQVEHLTRVIDEMSKENTLLMKYIRNRDDQIAGMDNKIYMLRKYITDKIEKGN